MIDEINMLKKARDICTYYTYRGECSKCPLYSKFYDKYSISDMLMEDNLVTDFVVIVTETKLRDNKYISLGFLLDIINSSYEIKDNKMYIFDKSMKKTRTILDITENLPYTIIKELSTCFDEAIYSDNIKRYFDNKDFFSGQYKKLYDVMKIRTDIDFREKKLVECIINPEKIYIPELEESQ